MKKALSLIILAGLMISLSVGSVTGWQKSRTVNIWGENHKVGSGEIVSKTFDLEPFTVIESDAAINITIVVGGSQTVSLSFDDNLINNLELEVHNGILEISGRGSYSAEKSGELVITMPKLEEIDTRGSGSIEIAEFKGGRFFFHNSGSGNFRASGTVDELDIDLDGSGNIDTRELIAKEVTVSLDGSGNIRVFAQDSFDGSLNGSGNIYYYGNPSNHTEERQGSGEIRRR
ncbi:MAG: head GIN domain-containing protein [candidate division Zixibacteria bacterium]|nr:head GIN domain-containing protein [candidate division Zixibacteria bacterium]